MRKISSLFRRDIGGEASFLCLQIQLSAAPPWDTTQPTQDQQKAAGGGIERWWEDLGSGGCRWAAWMNPPWPGPVSILLMSQDIKFVPPRSVTSNRKLFNWNHGQFLTMDEPQASSDSYPWGKVRPSLMLSLLTPPLLAHSLFSAWSQLRAISTSGSADLKFKLLTLKRTTLLNQRGRGKES